MPAWVAAGFDDYAKRLPRECALELVELKPEPRDRGRTRRADAGRRSGAHRAACAGCADASRSTSAAPRGRRASSPTHLAALAGCAATNVAFVIGSADGLARGRQARAAAVVALSAMTLPHGARARRAGRAALSRRSAARPVIRIIASRRRRLDGAPAMLPLYLASRSPRRQELLRQTRRRVRDAAAARGGRAAIATSSRRRSTPSRRCTTSSAWRAPRRRWAGSGCRSASSPSARCSAPTPRSCSTANLRQAARRRRRRADARAAVGPHARSADGRRAALPRPDRSRGVAFEGHVAQADRGGDRALRRHRRAVRQGRRVRDPGTRGGVHHAPRRQLLGRHGPAAGETATLLARIGVAVL